MMNSLIAMGLITVLWVLAAGFAGLRPRPRRWPARQLSLPGFANLGTSLPGLQSAGASPMAIMVFQMMFAVITAALISGGTTDRIKFFSFVILIGSGSSLVYVPIAHWVFSPEGWLARRGVLDFAGGTVVEICSGFSTLAWCWCSAAAGAGRARPWRRTRSRSASWAWASCGSAGSASTPALPSA